MRRVLLLALAGVAACSPASDEQNLGVSNEAAAPVATSASARAAAAIAQAYADALKRSDYVAARSLWGHDGADSGGSAADLARGYAIYSTLDLAAGEPSAISQSGDAERIVVPLSGSATVKATKQTRPMEGLLYLTRPKAAGEGSAGDWRIWASDIRRAN